MATLADAGRPRRAFELTRAVELSCFAFCIAQAVFIVACYVKGAWLIDATGAPVANDFVNVWAAGRQALAGHAAAAYDAHAHKLIEDAAIGRAFAGEYPWNYPPPFFFVAAVLALLPLVTANVSWLLLTFPLYLAVVRRIVRDPCALLLACAFPGIVPNVMAGQNGFVTAALIGGALLLLEKRPLLAGCLIGCLTFKPQLGLLFPLVLIAGGAWRALASAAATTHGLHSYTHCRPPRMRRSQKEAPSSASCRASMRSSACSAAARALAGRCTEHSRWRSPPPWHCCGARARISM